jgi:GntR family transcriptional regulator
LIDKGSPVPIYYQIQQYIREKIKKNEWLVGEAIPSERILSELFEVSRMTIRQAVQGLVDEGVLTRRRGSGTFISNEKVEQPLKGVTSFTKLMELRGMKASSKIISFLKRISSVIEAEQLNIELNSNLLQIERIRLGDETPFAVETTVIPWTFSEGITEEDMHRSLYEYIENEKGLEIGEGSQSIEAISADNRIAELLDIPVGSPILLIEQVTKLKNGTPFEYVRSHYAGSRFKFYL